MRLKALIKSVYVGKYAIFANTLTAGTMTSLGDLTSQSLEIMYTPLDDISYQRTGNMAIVGFLTGPLVHYWYSYLDRKFPGSALRAVVKKLAMEMMMAVPYNVILLCGMCLLKSYSLTKIKEEAKNKLPLLLCTDFILWTSLQSINFLFIPAYLRVVGMKLNELLYIVIASHIINNDLDNPDVTISFKS